MGIKIKGIRAKVKHENGMIQNMNVIVKLKKKIDKSSRCRELEKVESSNPNSSFLTKVN